MSILADRKRTIDGNKLDRYFREAYYRIRPVIPKGLRIQLRRRILFRKLKRSADVWPIDETAKTPPDGWAGWPGDKKFALVLTHDVEAPEGLSKCEQLIKIDESLGFRSSFNFVAKSYQIPAQLSNYMRNNGFEVGSHGLVHAGNLFYCEKAFRGKAIEINRYLKEWSAVGFRCPSMYHDLELIGELNIEYDCSTFDTDPFEPQPDGAKTIFPFWVENKSNGKGYVELPYTIPQDHCLFVLMREKDIGIWKRKLEWIAEHGGMALLITHPDYMNFEGTRMKIGEYPAELYRNFLEYIKSRYPGQYWHVLPRDLARFWAQNYRQRK